MGVRMMTWAKISVLELRLSTAISLPSFKIQSIFTSTTSYIDFPTIRSWMTYRRYITNLDSPGVLGLLIA